MFTQRTLHWLTLLWLIPLSALFALVLVAIGASQVQAQQGTPPGGCAQKPSGLVSFWQGEGNANDALAINNGVLLNGATFAPGRVGQAFSLDGVDDHVLVSPAVGLNFGTTDFSVEGWVKTTTTKTWSTIVSFDAFNPAVYVFTSAGRLQLWPLIPSAVGGLNDGQFHHFAVTRQGITTTYYKDGAAAGTATGVTNIQGNQFLIGFDLFPGDHFPGLIDEVAVYNRALSSAEIQAVFNCVPPPAVASPPATLVSHWAGENVTVQTALNQPGE